jgi:hypothetical protein
MGTFFKVDGFITYDHPHTLAGVEYTARAEQTPHGPLWKKGGGGDEFIGIIIDPVGETCTREGSARAGRITLEILLRHAVGLAIGSVLDLTGALILIGVNRTVHFDPEPPARPRLHETTIPPWCLRIRRFAQEEH